VGEQLGRGVVRAVKNIRCGNQSGVAAADESIRITFAAPPGDDELQEKLNDRSPVGVHVYAPWAKRVQQRIAADDMPSIEDSFMQGMRIGPIVLVTIPGEPALEIGMAIERTLMQHSPDLQDVWSMGYTNDMLGYLCTAAQRVQGGYEPGAYVVFDRPAAFRDEETIVVKGAVRLSSRLGLS